LEVTCLRGEMIGAFARKTREAFSNGKDTNPNTELRQ
jgi:hypothetical protein